jgi:hypothetical protein
VKVITAHASARTVASRYRRVLPHETEVLSKLKALGRNPDPADVVKIIGANGKYWVYPECDQCNKLADVVVSVGQPPDYDSHTAVLCLKCVTKAFNLLTKRIQ